MKPVNSVNLERKLYQSLGFEVILSLLITSWIVIDCI
jgi:hypothetical protein